MRRVVITGMGIVSSIGNNTQEVLASLHEARSGISRAEKYAELGFRSQVQGAPTLDPSGVIDRRAMRFLGEGAAWNHVAMEQAIQDAGLEPTDVSNIRTGIIMGSGGPSTRTLVEAARSLGTRTSRLLARVHLPMLRASLSTAAALAFVDIMKEMPITLMTRPFGWDTLAVRVYEMTSEGQWERAALPSLAIVLVGLVPILFLTWRAETIRC